ncbi:MAG: polysaccharide export protein [Gammaproteobacteria bacterium]|jgi:polysaccharide biosynthesis/export protein VpsN|nr:polysaccharide export protein [Gammaproteobacteria bacterium]MBT4492094.1 polysaccharide export protein [Gammaproteobacteria bacterium]MBT7372346.1 polysaccharide export protein [Gammaproteobacteria bacterium]
MNSMTCALVLFLSAMILPFELLADSEYRLGAGDEISIKVYEEDDLSMTLKLDESGAFDFPYLGAMEANGKTVKKLKNEITTGLLQDILINPSVNVSILNYRDFYIDGEVKNPGGYAYQPGLTVKQAITLAGGSTEWASSSKYEILREGKGKANAANNNTPVRPGDTVTILEGLF